MKSVYDELDNLKRMLLMIASHMGSSCEVVLHDLTNGYESTIVEIVNGHVTSRRVGDCGSNLGLEVLRGKSKYGDRYNYITQNAEGRILRSSTMYIRDDKGEVIGALCLNYDITDLMLVNKTVQEFIGFSFEEMEKTEKVDEYFVNNVGDLIARFLAECQAMIGKPVALMSREDKIRGVEFLDKKGVFLITKAGDKVCEYLNISKHTLYQYLDVARNKTEREGK